MKNIIKISAVLLLISFSAFAQYGSAGGSDTRTMSMAKTYNASSFGVYSIGVNPANMMFGKNNVEFSTLLPLPNLSVGAGTNFMTMDDFNYFFGGVDGNSRVLSSSDKSRFNDLFKNGGEVSASFSFNLLSFMYRANPEVGSFGFSISDFAGGRFVIPAALPDLALNGNQLDKVYNFKDAELSSSWMRYYSLSYARELPEIEQTFFDKISVGASVKMVQGFYYVGFDKSNSSIVTGSDFNIVAKGDQVINAAFSPDFNMKYDFDSTSGQGSKNVGPFPKPAGTGFGFDFGVAAQMKEMRFSLALTDVGSVTWDQHPVRYTSTGSATINDVSNQDQVQSLGDSLKGKGEYISSFSTSLPTALRLGASYLFDSDDDDVPGKLLVALDYNQGFNSIVGNTTKPRVSVGADWGLTGALNIRTGLSFGGLDGFNWAFGLGLDTGLIQFNFATTDMQSAISPNSAKRLSFSMGTLWKF
jgi:hypothetical protein